MTMPSAGTIARSIVLLIALINQIAVTFSGDSLIQITDDGELEAGLTTIITVIASLVAGWKNNSFTKKAIAADTYMKNYDKIDITINDE